MNAIDFIQKFGWCSAINIVLNRPPSATSYRTSENNSLGLGGLYGRISGEPYGVVVSLDDLKRYVDAYEFVSKYKNRHGGVRFRVRWGMFRYGDTKEFNENLKQAITLVEEVENYNAETKEGDTP